MSVSPSTAAIALGATSHVGERSCQFPLSHALGPCVSGPCVSAGDKRAHEVCSMVGLATVAPSSGIGSKGLDCRRTWQAAAVAVTESA